MLGPKIGVLYGLTEAPVTCYLPPRALDADAVRRGRLIHFGWGALPDYEVHIAGSDERSSAGSAGEVLIRGGNVMAGYWQDEDATRAALRDGWLQPATSASSTTPAISRSSADSRTSSAPAAAPSCRRRSRT